MNKIYKILNWCKCLITLILIFLSLFTGYKLGVDDVCTQLEFYREGKQTVLPCFNQDKEIIEND